MSYETDGLKRDLERLSLEFRLAKNDHDRELRNLARRIDNLETITASGSVVDGVVNVPALEQRLTAIEEAMPSSTAELLALASTRLTGLLGVLAHDEMTTVRKLEAIVEKLPSRTITTGGNPYLTRWYLWPEGPRDVEDEGSDLPFAVFLHKFHRGDADRDLHSHPWDLSVAIVLAGGYREERGDAVHTHLPGSVNVIRGDDFHRVDLLNPEMGSWSLFVAGRKTGGWGFRDRVTGAFIPQQEYLRGMLQKTTAPIMGSHRAHVRGADGVTHDVRVWRTAAAACRAVVFDPPENGHVASLERLGFRLIREGAVVDNPVDCMSCLAARRTPYAVLCDDHGQQFLTAEQYERQLNRPDSFWSCPRCGESAHWDDDEYEANLDEGPNDDEVDRQAT